MSKVLARHWLAAAMLAFLLPMRDAHAQTATIAVPPEAPPAYIVTLRADVDPDDFARECGVRPTCCYRRALKGFAARLDAETVARLKRDARVRAVEEDGPLERCEQTIGAGLVRMGVPGFPFAMINGLDERFDVDVAVIDSGIQDHPDLNIYRKVGFAGIAEGEPGYGGDDWEGHGTRMAGIIGALDNDFGIVGVAAGVRLWSVQIAAPGDFSWSNVLAGFEYVAQHVSEIEVANCSFVYEGKSAPVVAAQEAIASLVNQGVVVVAGVGNSRRDIIGTDGEWGTADDSWPAASPQVMAVSNIDPRTDTFAESSGYSFDPRPGSFVNSPGGAIDVAAPGVGILTTGLDGTYELREVGGTSLSTAHVSGLVALYIAANGRAHTADDVYRIRQKIVDTALPQSAWASGPRTKDRDLFPEPLAMPHESWFPVSIPTPRIIAQSRTPAGFQFSFTTVPGYRYTAQHATALSTANGWTDLTTTNATGDTATILDPTRNVTGFYRVVLMDSDSGDPTNGVPSISLAPAADARIGGVLGTDGASIYLSVYNDGGNIQRTLLKFNLSALPANKVITNAVLKLYADPSLYSAGNPNGQPMELYRVTRPWEESQVTWSQAANGDAWLSAGGDFVGASGAPGANPYAANNTAIQNNFPLIVEFEWDVTALVQEWHAGTHPNFGLLVLSHPGNGLTFRSRENVSNKPVLDIQLADELLP